MQIESLEQSTRVKAPSSVAQDVAPGERYGVVGRTNPELLESMFGCFANDPAFERVVQFIENERAREREEAEREADLEDLSAV